ncbi:MAG TPA: polysaccharide deacetylase family protein [Candidatus Bathyarchaeia archaeon]|nr:polysaccharide deacetylase family protein [Candidatus Bathyarchaeia archaeon]
MIKESGKRLPHYIKITGNLLLTVILTLSLLFQNRILVSPVNAEAGNTVITKWKGNKEGALSIQFADGWISQADIAIPALNQRGLIGSFFIAPGLASGYYYNARKEIWENQVYQNGHEFDNHTWSHSGAQSYEEADQEISRLAEYIWSLKPNDLSKFHAFVRPGGVPWEITASQEQTILNKYHVFRLPWEGHHSFADEYEWSSTVDKMFAFVQQAIDEKIWVKVAFHGIDEHGLSVNKSNFLGFLDKIAAAEDRVWNGGYTQIYKYIQERDTATISILEVNENRIILKLISDQDSSLYDQPLTLITEVPIHWQTCLVNQDRTYPVKNGHVQYEVIPNKGDTILTGNPKDCLTGNDKKINADDVLLLLGNYLKTIIPLDFHGDNLINTIDYGYLIQIWGQTCN